MTPCPWVQYRLPETYEEIFWRALHKVRAHKQRGTEQ